MTIIDGVDGNSLDAKTYFDYVVPTVNPIYMKYLYSRAKKFFAQAKWAVS